MRLRFILGLIILAVALHFIAKTLNGVLPIMQEAAQYPLAQQAFHLPINPPKQPLQKGAQKNALFTKAARDLKERFTQTNPTRLINPTERTSPADNTPENAFLQITLEDIRPALKNNFLGPEASARLDAFLQQKRSQNVLLADETGRLFGENAKKEIIYILAEDEKESLLNARNSKTAQEYAQRQQETDEKISKKLKTLFEKYKKQLNRRTNENSPAWNEFFKRVNSFQKAADL